MDGWLFLESLKAVLLEDPRQVLMPEASSLLGTVERFQESADLVGELCRVLDVHLFVEVCDDVGLCDVDLM